MSFIQAQSYFSNAASQADNAAIVSLANGLQILARTLDHELKAIKSEANKIKNTVEHTEHLVRTR